MNSKMGNFADVKLSRNTSEFASDREHYTQH